MANVNIISAPKRRIPMPRGIATTGPASHISLRRASTIADIEHGKDAGEFPEDIDPELLVDAIFGPMYYRLMLRLMPLTEEYGDNLIDQVLRGLRSNPGRPIV